VVVRVGPEVPAGGLLAFGRVLAGVAAAGGRRVAVVASGDLAHAHDARGPYGADPAARAFDRRVLRAVAGEGPDGLLHLDPSLVARAKPDAVPQLLVLAGLLREAALSGRPLRPEVLAYEVPTYFGMLCAVYE
jgi:aromatic ring-opening dioxygenase LigB subunit